MERFECEAKLSSGSLSRGRETTCLAESYHMGGRGQWEQTLSIRRDESLDPQNLGIRGPHIAQCQAPVRPLSSPTASRDTSSQMRTGFFDGRPSAWTDVDGQPSPWTDDGRHCHGKHPIASRLPSPGYPRFGLMCSALMKWPRISRVRP